MSQQVPAQDEGGDGDPLPLIETAADREEEEFHGPPRWVKVLGGIALLVVVLIAVLLLFGGGQHSPMRHGRAHTQPGLAAVTLS